MSLELPRVLVVGDEPSESFIAALQDRGLHIATTSQADFETALEGRRFDLVVALGFDGCDRLVAALGRRGKPRLRAALLVERSALADARQLDRKVVATVLPQDLRTDVLAERLVTLARRQHGGASGPVPAPLPPTALPRRPPLPGRPSPPVEHDETRESVGPGPNPHVHDPLPPVPPPPPPRMPAPTAAASMPRRVVLLDDDVTRGDLLAQALREKGITVQLAPTDPVRTRWELLRRFRPERFLHDSTTPVPPAWLERRASDAELARASLCSVPFAQLFEDITGAGRIELLLERATSSIPAAPDPHEPSKSEDSSPKPPTSSTSEEVDDERPTLIYEGSVAAPLPQGSLDPVSPHVGEADPVDELLREPPVEAGPAVPRLPVAAPVRRGHTWVKVAGALGSVAALGGVLWWFSRGDGPPITSVSAAEATQPPAAPSAPAESTEPAVEPAAPPTPPPSPWETPEHPDARPCEALVDDAASLPRGDVAQASQAWKRARNALVLGDVALAQSWMCRAVLIHEQSLAVEALAESYLEIGAPRQAKRWVEVALTHRPDRARTLELLGDIEHQLGHVDEARRAWLRAFRIDDDAEGTLALLGKKLLPEAEAALRSSRTHRAEVLFRRAATFRPDDAEPVLGLARVARAREQRETALRWIAEALRRDPENPRALALRAELDGTPPP